MEKFLNNEEKKLFSKKSLKKIKKNDFRSYLDIEENTLEFMKEQYERDGKFKNKVLEEQINTQEDLVETLNNYYNDVILKRDKTIRDETDFLEKEFEDMLKVYKRIQKDS